MTKSIQRWCLAAALVALLLGVAGCRATEARLPPVRAPTSPECPRAIPSSSTPNVVEARVAWPGARIEYRIRASLLANVAYFLDCVSWMASRSCSRDAFVRIGEHLGGLSEDDHAALKTWAAIFGRYQGEITDTLDAYDAPLPLSLPLHQVALRTTLVGYTSDTIVEYEGKLAALVDPADAARAAEVLRRFMPRFERYWRENEPYRARLLASIAAGAAQPAFQRQLDSIAAFYDADLPAGSEPTVQLILKPEAGGLRGDFLGHVARIEIGVDTSHEEALGVIAHELAHYLFSRVPARRLTPLVEQLANGDGRTGYAGYGLLDEALATAWQAGLVSKLLSPQSFEANRTRSRGLYDDELIDAMAKGLVPEVDELVAKRVRLGDEAFFTAYMRASRRAFAAGIPPKALLHPSSVAYAPDLELALREYRSWTTNARWDQLGSVAPKMAADFFGAHPKWTRVLLLRRADLPVLAGWRSLLSSADVSEIVRVARGSDTLAYAVLEKGKPAVFVLVADSAADMIWLLRRLGDLRGTRAGVLTL